MLRGQAVDHPRKHPRIRIGKPAGDPHPPGLHPAGKVHDGRRGGGLDGGLIKPSTRGRGKVPPRVERRPVVPRSRVERLLMQEINAVRNATDEVQCPLGHATLAPCFHIDEHDAGIAVRGVRGDTARDAQRHPAWRSAQRDRRVDRGGPGPAREIVAPERPDVVEHEHVGVEEEHTADIRRQQTGKKQRRGSLEWIPVITRKAVETRARKRDGMEIDKRGDAVADRLRQVSMKEIHPHLPRRRQACRERLEHHRQRQRIPVIDAAGDCDGLAGHG